MKSSKSRIAIVMLVIGAAAAIAIAFSGPATAAPIPTVRSIAPMAADDIPSNNLKAIGTFTAADQANLSFLSGGRLKEIKVKEGDRVQTGALLASIDTSTLDLQAAQAKAVLDGASASFAKIKAGPTSDDIAIAKSNLDRAKETVAQTQAAYDRIGGDSNPFGAMTPQALALQQAYSAYQAAVASYNLTVNHPTDSELKIAQAQLAQAQSALDLAKQNIANASIVAPLDGAIVWIGPHIGESISPGAPVMTLTDLSHMQVSVEVDENSLSQIQLGQTVKITADALPGQILTGHVSKIGILATTTAGIVSVPVTVDVDPTDLAIVPGLSANVEFNTGK
jgi:multidrug efflux pump subunit AcrA (membrane-fusion protein)